MYRWDDGRVSTGQGMSSKYSRLFNYLQMLLLS